MQHALAGDLVTLAGLEHPSNRSDPVISVELGVWRCCSLLC